MNAINHNNNNNRYNNDKTMTTPSIKINFQGASRDVNVPAPVSLASLQAAIAAAFDAELPVRSPAGEAAKDTDLSFTYKDPDGDDIVFDKDSELKLAVRLCPSSLEISATLKESEPAKKPDPEARLYKIAARNLREYNGVPSMTAPKLIKTLAFLKLNPQRLVKQGLAPKVLLARMKAEAANNAKVSKVPLGDGKNNEDLAESVAAGMELMSVEDDKKEWNDGFVSAESDASAAAVPITAKTSTPDNDNEEENNDAAPEAKKNLIHKAFITGGIQLCPREVRPLLVALDVRPCRLAKLGLVDGKDLRAMLQAEKKAAHKRHGPGHGGPRGPTGGFARGPAGLIMRVGSVRPGAGPSPGSGSGASGRTPEAGANVVPLGRGKMRAVFCGKPRVGMMMPRRCHPHAGMPPPPRPHMEHARAPGGGGGGVGQQQHGRHR